MSSFTFDTSGLVPLREAVPPGVIGLAAFGWEDLSPFAQGYVEALFAGSATWTKDGELRCLTVLNERAGFSDLAPEALAMILRDCEAFAARVGRRLAVDMPGAQFWHARQHGFPVTCAEDRGFLCSFFPPLTVFLNDDGKVCLTLPTKDGEA